jgi:leader peptidase (prepilin peptidase)/N-methyltransferase
VIDFRHYIIPDFFTLPMLGIAVALSFIPGSPLPVTSLIGILAGGGTLYFIGWLGAVLFKKGEAMGGGDIKMMAAAGALWGGQTALLGILFGALLGSVFGITIMAIKRINSDHRIPFGPFLGAGVWVAVLYGEELFGMYLRYIDRAAGM